MSLNDSLYNSITKCISVHRKNTFVIFYLIIQIFYKIFPG